MIARINQFGQLEIEPENTTEAYALQNWISLNGVLIELDDTDKTVFLGTTIHVKPLDLTSDDSLLIPGA